MKKSKFREQQIVSILKEVELGAKVCLSFAFHYAWHYLDVANFHRVHNR